MDMAKDKENQEIIGLLNRQTAVANPNVSHGEIIFVIYYTWQSCEKSKIIPSCILDSLLHSKLHITEFLLKGGARTCFKDT